MGYKLKRILIYPDGVTEKQVYPAIIPQDGLLGYWKFEDDVLDYSGNNKNATKYGSASFGTVGDKKGIRLGTAFTNNPSNYLTISNISPTTTFSFCGWVYDNFTSTSGTNKWQSIIENSAQDNNNSLRIRTAYKDLIPATYGTFGGSTIDTNTWVFIVVTSDGTTANLYINGSLVYTWAAGTTTSGASSTFSIGRGNGNGNRWGWYGWIRQFVLYDRALTSGEVLRIYNLTA